MPRQANKPEHSPDIANNVTKVGKVVQTEAAREPAGSKIDQVIELLQRNHGATLGELTKITGWQPHSVRAVLTALRKKGHAITKSKRSEVTCYCITGRA